LRVPLIAEFKGVPELALVLDAATTGPKIVSLDLGQVPVGSMRALSAYAKNVGTRSSLLTISGIRTEPAPSLLFDVDTSSAAPVYLNSFRSDAICTGGGACPSGTRCVDGLCVQENGAPLDTLLLTVTFSPAAEGLF
jgi:hypothetical protein